MSTRTTNLNLIKPELNDNIVQSIADFNTNSDILDSAVYQKPNDGIPSTDLASAVQTSLSKADTAIQEHQSLDAYRTSANQDAIDATLQSRTDASLTTTAQTVVGAINEHESDISQLKEDKADKSDMVTTINSSSTDSKYPTAKAVYDFPWRTDLLWTNASMDSDFSPQTISIDLSGYNYVLIQYRGLSGWTNDLKSEITPVGWANVLSLARGNNYIRGFSVNSSGIIFAENDKMNTYGNEDYISIYNSVNKPYRIYGIK